jgi:hypothetical protein
VDEELIYSKFDTGRFPRPQEILDLLDQRVGREEG